LRVARGRLGFSSGSGLDAPEPILMLVQVKFIYKVGFLKVWKVRMKSVFG
jgi:hypothetical protein